MNPIIAKAREILAGRGQQEAADKIWREEHADQLAAAEIDVLLAKTAAPTIKRDYNGDGMVYKRNDNALQQPEQRQTFMNPETAKGWHAWCNSLIDVKLTEYDNTHIRKHIEDINGEFHDLLEFSKELRQEIKALRTKIDEQKARIVLFDPSEAMAKEIEKATAPLRAEITTLRKQISELKKRV